MKWGVISTAKIATEKVIPAMQESNQLEILAIAGRDPGKTVKRPRVCAFHAPMAPMRNFSPIRRSKRSTIRCPIIFMSNGRSRRLKRANMFCAKNPSVLIPTMPNA